MMIDTNIGQDDHSASSATARPQCVIGNRATAGDRGERGSASAAGFGGAAPSASCLRGGVLPGMDAGLFWGLFSGPLFSSILSAAS